MKKKKMSKKSKIPDIKKISDAEWEVVYVLWNQGESTAAEVCEQLVGQFDWSPKTIRTFLARLVQKGVIGVALKDGINRYRTLIEETSAKQAVGQTFLQKFFSGMLPSMVAHFVNDENVTLEELAKLQKVIEKRRNEMKQ